MIDPLSVAAIIGGATFYKMIDSLVKRGAVEAVKRKFVGVDVHKIRAMEISLNGEAYSQCNDFTCAICYGQATVSPAFGFGVGRERIVDGNLVPVPRHVPDEADAYSTPDTLTDNVIIYWTWMGKSGMTKVRSLAPKHEVREIDEATN